MVFGPLTRTIFGSSSGSRSSNQPSAVSASQPRASLTKSIGVYFRPSPKSSMPLQTIERFRLRSSSARPVLDDRQCAAYPSESVLAQVHRERRCRPRASRSTPLPPPFGRTFATRGVRSGHLVSSKSVQDRRSSRQLGGAVLWCPFSVQRGLCFGTTCCTEMRKWSISVKNDLHIVGVQAGHRDGYLRDI